MSKLRPMLDRVIVKREEPEAKSRGGILLPDTAKEKPKRGKVLAVGPGSLTARGERVPMDLEPGQVVLFNSYAGSEVEEGGEQYLILGQLDVLAVVE